MTIDEAIRHAREEAEELRMFSGYESPITQILGEMRIQMEDECMKAVQQCGFDVNKEELARALIYDRDQYDKGYDDGYNKAIDDFVEAVRRKFPDDRNAITNLEIIAEQLKAGGVE